MNRRHFIAAVATSIAMTSSAVQSNQPGRDIVVVADLDAQNPIIKDARYNKRATDLLSQEISKLNLQYGDRLHLRSTGDWSTLGELYGSWNRTRLIDYHDLRPKGVDTFMQDRMAELLTIVGQPSNELMWKFEEVGGEFGCQSGQDTIVIALTSGIQIGHMDGPDYTMNIFSGTPYSGCSVLHFIGFAVNSGGFSTQEIGAARKTFSDFGKAVGFNHVAFHK